MCRTENELKIMVYGLLASEGAIFVQSALHIELSIVLLRCAYTIKLLRRHSGLSLETSQATSQSVWKRRPENRLVISPKMYGCGRIVSVEHRFRMLLGYSRCPY